MEINSMLPNKCGVKEVNTGEIRYSKQDANENVSHQNLEGDSNYSFEQ